MALPPGPRSKLWTTYQVGAHPLAALTRMRARYGDPFRCPTVNGEVVCTAEPELIREVFANKDRERFGVFASGAMDAFFGSHSLLLLEGEAHRRERKLLTPPFHGERMRAYGELMQAAARRALGELDEGEGFVALERMQAISLEVIVRAVFGVDEAGRVDAHADAVVATLDAAKPMFMFAKATQVAPFGLGPWARYQRASAEADRLLYEQIDRVRDQADEREDILSLMLAARYEDGSRMSDEELRDELRTLLIAGHETTAITMAWALYALHRHPEVKAELLAELDALTDPGPEALAKAPLLAAVVDETLRLFPVVEVVFRKLREPWQFGGYDLPVGWAIAPTVNLVHRRPDLYPEPERFNPRRMLERKPGPFEFLPFGGGNRRCVGAAFAHYEARVALGTLLREFELELREPKPVATVRRSVTLGPNTGVRMALLRRR